MKKRPEEARTPGKTTRTPGKDKKTRTTRGRHYLGGPKENDWKWSYLTGTTGRGKNTGTTRRHFENDWTLFNLEGTLDTPVGVARYSAWHTTILGWGNTYMTLHMLHVI